MGGSDLQRLQDAHPIIRDVGNRQQAINTQRCERKELFILRVQIYFSPYLRITSPANKFTSILFCYKCEQPKTFALFITYSSELGISYVTRLCSYICSWFVIIQANISFSFFHHSSISTPLDLNVYLPCLYILMTEAMLNFKECKFHVQSSFFFTQCYLTSCTMFKKKKRPKSDILPSVLCFMFTCQKRMLKWFSISLCGTLQSVWTFDIKRKEKLAELIKTTRLYCVYSGLRATFICGQVKPCKWM